MHHRQIVVHRRVRVRDDHVDRARTHLVNGVDVPGGTHELAIGQRAGCLQPVLDLGVVANQQDPRSEDLSG